MSMNTAALRLRLACLSAAAMMMACGGGGGGGDSPPPPPPPPAAKYDLAGEVGGLADGTSLTLSVNGAAVRSIGANGPFTVADALNDRASYAVTATPVQEIPAQSCTVTSGQGTVAGADVQGIRVDCTLKTFDLSGTLSGLRGHGLLLMEGTQEIGPGADGTIGFGPLASGSAYNVTVKRQPADPSQTCTVNRGSGTIGATDVSDLFVVCSTNTYLLGGTVQGLAGSGLTLQDNGSNDKPINANGEFSFDGRLASGADYAVTVNQQPSHPSQVCSVNDGTGLGTVTDQQVTSVRVVCNTNTYFVGGTVSGLSGVGLILQNNGADDLTLSNSGAFEFPQSVASGAKYGVTVKSQPLSPSQTCTVNAGSGNGQVDATDVSSVRVTCATNSYRIGGSASGLLGTGLVLQNNGADDLAVNADGNFVFKTPVASGAGFGVTVKGQPHNPSQFCTAFDADDRDNVVLGADQLQAVKVVCTTNQNSVGGTGSGLTGSGLALQHNGADALTISANGSFSFALPLASGTRFAVTIRTQPTGQQCTLTNAQGTITAGDVSNVGVSCIASQSQFVMVADASGQVATWRIDPTNGLLLRVGGASVGEDARALALSPSKKNVYVLSPTRRSVTTMAFDEVTGALRVVGTTSLSPTAMPQVMAITPDGRFLYVVGDQITVLRIDTSSPVPVVTGLAYPHSSAPPDIVMDAAGRFTLISKGGGIGTYSIDSTSGALTEVVGTGFNPSFVTQPFALHPSSRYLYVATGNGLRGIRVDPLTGTLTEYFGPIIGVFSQQISAISPSGRWFVHSPPAVDDRPTLLVELISIDAATGLMTPSAQLTSLRYVASLAFGPDERFVYSANGDPNTLSVYAIDQVTGSMQSAGTPIALPAWPNEIIAFDSRESGVATLLKARRAAGVAASAPGRH